MWCPSEVTLVDEGEIFFSEEATVSVKSCLILVILLGQGASCACSVHLNVVMLDGVDPTAGAVDVLRIWRIIREDKLEWRTRCILQYHT